MINEKNIFWLWAGWVASYLQRSLSAQVNGGPDATTDRWKQPFSAVRVSGACPGNAILLLVWIFALIFLAFSVQSLTTTIVCEIR